LSLTSRLRKVFSSGIRRSEDWD